MSRALAYRAPGRVNLIGDHTDYNEGFVLPLALELECTVRARTTGDGRIRLRSEDVEGEVDVAADGSTEPEEVGGWGRYAAGVARVLARRGRRPAGLEGVVASSVPVAAGLSSSAALEVALALALCDAGGLTVEPLELALACQEAEHVATGVPSGIMDQLTSVAGIPEHALLIDCRSLDVRPVRLPQELAVVVAHSGTSRELAGSAYAERRAGCEAVAARLGLRALRDATPEQVANEPHARHVVSENARVLAAAAALEAGDLAALGSLLSASHRSLRDDYEVSTPELDALVAALEGAGAAGARLTGAGFGGCAVAVTLVSGAPAVAASAAARYHAESGLEPRTWICRPAAGAGKIAA